MHESNSPENWCGYLAVMALAGLALPAALAQENPQWLGRPFVKVLAKGDPIPGGNGALFNEITRFTLHNGTLHIVAGESSNRKGLFRWRGGQLTKLVYTDTKAPTGGSFDTVHFTTDETEGALNFVGEIFFGKPGFTYGLFEWRDGVITKVFDTSQPVNGLSLMGLGYPVRVGHEVVGSSQFVDDTGMKNGILRWDGTSLRTVIKSGDDLPGSLGGFTGHPGQYQIAFDGQSVAFVASDDPRGKGPLGIYRTQPDGSLIKLLDGNDPFPGGGTYASAGMTFVNVDIDGPHSFLGISEMVAAAKSGNQFYGLGVRYTDGHLDTANGVFGTDGTIETLIPFAEADGVTRTKLDGEIWTNIYLVDGEGDDVALLVRLESGRQAIYAAVGPTSNLTPPTLNAPSVVAGKLRLRFASQAGKTYRIEFKSALDANDWTSRGDLAGTGAELEFEDPTGSTGFYRVALLP